ncbi:hypothetical protein SN10121_16570 [Ligilactobacillus agilis]|nr:hypothetical protein SN10121_16570 [Ligilactobacillus agilis]
MQGTSIILVVTHFLISYDVEGCDTPGCFATSVAVISTELVLFLK